MKSVFAKTPSGEIQITITIPSTEVKKTYAEVLEKVAKEAELPGFRKGKAPVNLVEEKSDKAKIYEEVLEQLVPQSYMAAIKEHNLKPIVSPKVELLKAKEDEDWEIRATTCEQPRVDLGNYKEEIKKILSTPKLWVPGDNKEEKETKEEDCDAKTQRAIQALLDKIAFVLPELLIEDEANRALSGLIQQTNSLGLTIEQYLTSIGKTSDQIREEYRQRVMQDLKLQITLDKISQEEKLEVTDKEVEDLINATGDQKAKENLSNPAQVTYIKGILLRRKALDFITNL